MRQHQLVVMTDSYNNDIILGRGKFDVFKLMSLSVTHLLGTSLTELSKNGN